ncbi:SMI1/KNR4 family protein [Sphingomonas morindae]|uniref:SMI1/KNR4 family protein n=1 Tax=Sphingomonas morindae TaxID=1541170 RepID=A0ABY4X980_9SPHN|nr:SMI1/KNR4 family protein [Sphingomonas morindae]USI73472.1 SMI1/KNR4 family protein [Sphingomonas morindae]
MDMIFHHGPMDRNAIIAFGQERGISLPEFYVALMEKYNGAQFTKDTFKFVIDGKEDCLSFGFCGYGEWPVSDIIDKFQDIEFVYLEKYMVFGVTGAGDYLAFVPEGDPPENHVKLLIHDDSEEGPHGDQMRIVDVARNFDEFLAGLFEWED